MSGALGVLIAVVLLVVNAFFVGAEFALISTRRSLIEPRAFQGSRRARITLNAMERVSLMLAGAQLGITLASLGLGAVAEPAIAHLLEGAFDAAHAPRDLLHPAAFVIALAIVVFLHVVIGEMVPKNLALAAPESAALALTPALVLVVRVLRPALAAVNALANLSLRLVHVARRDELASAYTHDEIAQLIAESHQEGLLAEEEHELLSGALGFGELTVESVMLPTSQLVVIRPDATPHDVEELAARTGFSRFPVMDDGGELIGYVHLKDVLETNPVRRAAPIQSKWVRPLRRLGLDDTLAGALALMQSGGAHLARVTAHGGESVGVVALEDVLEELVGEMAAARPAPPWRRSVPPPP